MKIVVDTTPLVAAAHTGDSAHAMARTAMRRLRRNADFRATESAHGPWRLAIDERIYERELRR